VNDSVTSEFSVDFHPEVQSGDSLPDDWVLSGLRASSVQSIVKTRRHLVCLRLVGFEVRVSLRCILVTVY